MKRIALTFITIAAMLMCTVSVYALPGIPTKAEFTKAIKVDGCSSYADVREINSNMPSGYLDGGTAFYVYKELKKYYYGTTETAEDPKNYENFVYVQKDDTISSAEVIGPDVGEDIGETVKAKTTDLLNLRKGPGTGFDAIKVLDKGQKVTYNTTINTSGEWAYVKAGSDHGWVFTEYLEEVDDTAKAQTADKDKAEADDSGDKAEASSEDKAGETSGDQGDQSAAGNTDKSKSSSEASTRSNLTIIIVCSCFVAALLLALIAFMLIRKKDRD